MEPKISAADKEQMRSAKAKAAEYMDLEADEDDPNFFLDNLSEKSPDQQFEAKQMLQKEQDNKKIALVYEAL
jgi:hypothetical protein